MEKKKKKTNQRPIDVNNMWEHEEVGPLGRLKIQLIWFLLILYVWISPFQNHSKAQSEYKQTRNKKIQEWLAEVKGKRNRNKKEYERIKERNKDVNRKTEKQKNRRKGQKQEQNKA